MSKKSKDIELMAKDETVTYQGKQYEGTTLWMGKQLVGSIVKTTMYEAFTKGNEQHPIKVRSFEEAVEALIREWNLSQP